MKKALLAVDGTDRSTALLSVVKTMKPESVVLVHVHPFMTRTSTIGRMRGLGMSREPIRTKDRKEALDRETENIMRFFRKELEDGGPATVTMQVREGDPGQEILRAAREEDADVIVLGSGRKSRLRRLLAGSVAAEVERHAQVPVLVSKTSGSKKTIVYDWRGEVYASQ